MKRKVIDSLLDKYEHTGLKLFDPNTIKVNTEGNPYSKWGFKGPEMDVLRESIKENGIFHPIYIREDGICLSGNRRLVISQELGRDVPGYQFLVPINQEDENILIHHPNNAQRNLTTSERDKMIIDRFGEMIGSPKSLPFIAQKTGIHLDIIKKISSKAKKHREFQKRQKSLTEQDYKANLPLFRELEKVKGKLNHYMRERNRVIKSLEETAPMEVWTKWIKEWEKQKRKGSE